MFWSTDSVQSMRSFGYVRVRIQYTVSQFILDASCVTVLWDPKAKRKKPFLDFDPIPINQSIKLGCRMDQNQWNVPIDA